MGRANTMMLSGVTLMRFRDTAVDVCDPKNIDDDAEWKRHVIEKIGCIPPYWKYTTPYAPSLTIFGKQCQLSEFLFYTFSMYVYMHAYLCFISLIQIIGRRKLSVDVHMVVGIW